MRIITFAILLLSLALFQSCGCDNTGLSVNEYIETNNISATELDEGVFIDIHEPGNDIMPTLDDKFEIIYEGRLTDGSIFDSNTTGFSGQLYRMIRGWQIGIRKLGEGGKATLIIPASAGYGDQERINIPCNSTLIFDVEVISYN